LRDPLDHFPVEVIVQLEFRKRLRFTPFFQNMTVNGQSPGKVDLEIQAEHALRFDIFGKHFSEHQNLFLAENFVRDLDLDLFILTK